MKVDLRQRHFLKLQDFSSDEIRGLVALARELKAQRARGSEEPRLAGRVIALVFEKTSTRTRCAFEVAAWEQGAGVSVLDPSGSQIGHKESVRDTARILGRLYHGIAYRGFGQEIVEELAGHAGVPVWNALTDEHHPTQILADVLTIEEHADRPLSEIAVCYLGDARFNMANSLLVGASKLGFDLRIAAPRALWPDSERLASCRRAAAQSGSRLLVSEDPEEAVRGADFLYTDIWLSMGEAETAWAERIGQLRPYRVDERILEMAANRQVKFMHCLPALHDRRTDIGRRLAEQHGLEGLEVSDEVFESSRSIVFDQAENRLHTIKAILVATLGPEPLPAAGR